MSTPSLFERYESLELNKNVIEVHSKTAVCPNFVLGENFTNALAVVAINYMLASEMTVEIPSLNFKCILKARHYLGLDLKINEFRYSKKLFGLDVQTNHPLVWFGWADKHVILTIGPNATMSESAAATHQNPNQFSKTSTMPLNTDSNLTTPETQGAHLMQDSTYTPDDIVMQYQSMVPSEPINPDQVAKDESLEINRQFMEQIGGSFDFEFTGPFAPSNALACVAFNTSSRSIVLINHDDEKRSQQIPPNAYLDAGGILHEIRSIDDVRNLTWVGFTPGSREFAVVEYDSMIPMVKPQPQYKLDSEEQEMKRYETLRQQSLEMNRAWLSSINADIDFHFRGKRQDLDKRCVAINTSTSFNMVFRSNGGRSAICIPPSSYLAASGGVCPIISMSGIGEMEWLGFNPDDTTIHFDKVSDPLFLQPIALTLRLMALGVFVDDVSQDPIPVSDFLTNMVLSSAVSDKVMLGALLSTGRGLVCSRNLIYPAVIEDGLFRTVEWSVDNIDLVFGDLPQVIFKQIDFVALKDKLKGLSTHGIKVIVLDTLAMISPQNIVMAVKEVINHPRALNDSNLMDVKHHIFSKSLANPGGLNQSLPLNPQPMFHGGAPYPFSSPGVFPVPGMQPMPMHMQSQMHQQPMYGTHMQSQGFDQYSKSFDRNNGQR